MNENKIVAEIPADVRELLPLVRASRSVGWFEKGTVAILLHYDGSDSPNSNVALRLLNEGMYRDPYDNFVDFFGDDHEFWAGLHHLEGENEFGTDLLEAFREEYALDINEKVGL